MFRAGQLGSTFPKYERHYNCYLLKIPGYSSVDSNPPKVDSTVHEAEESLPIELCRAHLPTLAAQMSAT